MEPRALRFYTSNEGKVREASEVLGPLGFRIVWARSSLLEPQADTLEEVARSKLRQVPPGEGWSMVEDSGLFLPALKGFPGVYSAYVLRTIGLSGVLRLVEGRDRGAEFQAVIGLHKGEETRFFHGRVLGTIAREARGSNGFGYDPIFVPDGEARTAAELSSREKNALSHRGRALRATADFLATPPVEDR